MLGASSGNPISSTMQALSHQLEADPSAAAAARRAVRRLPLEADERFALDLLVSELVSNSVRHGELRRDDRIGLEVRLSDRTLRVEVIDPGRNGDPVPREPDPGGGWGLRLVATLANRWGVQRANRMVVWFELDRGRLPLPSRGVLD